MSQQRRGKETRNEILQAAEALFAREGYEAAGVAEICQEAGVSKGAFYHHFQTKEEVFLELFQSWVERLDTQLSLLGKAKGNVAERIFSMTGVLQEVLQAAQEGMPIYLEFWVRALRDPYVMRIMSAPFHRFREFFSGMLEAEIGEKGLSIQDATTAAQVFLSFALGLLVQGIVDPEGADWEQVSRQGIEVLLRGYEKR
jgi:AcrR family transcriptional regulator